MATLCHVHTRKPDGNATVRSTRSGLMIRGKSGNEDSFHSDS
jgi:hypothetical protein